VALFEVPDAERSLAREGLDRALGEDPAEIVVHLGRSSLRRSIWALPAIDAALRRFDRAAVTWSASPLVRSLLEGHLEAKRSSAHVVAPTPRGLRLDLLLDGAPLATPALRPGRSSFPLRVRAAYHVGDGIHLAARWARGASNAGLDPASERPALALPASARRHAQGLAHALAGRWNRPLVALLPARRPHRRWGAPAMASLARTLRKRFGARVFVWPPEPIEGCSLPSAFLPPVSAAALLSLTALCVGDDDGWAHVAAAVGAPTLTVHGPTCPVRSGPASALGAAVGAPPCRTGEHPRGPARRCLRCLEPSDLLDLAEQLVMKRRPHDLVARWR
jgi:glycosyl transferase family 9 (putative heptosyltransferase)